MSKQVLGSGLTLAVLTSFLLGIGYESFAAQGMDRPAYVALGILLVAAILWVTEAVPLFVTSMILLLPIIVGLSVATASPLMIGTAFGCSLAMPLPISTPPNAMAFSSGRINVMDMAKPGVILTLIGVALALTTGYWWWQTMGLW